LHGRLRENTFKSKFSLESAENMPEAGIRRRFPLQGINKFLQEFMIRASTHINIASNCLASRLVGGMVQQLSARALGGYELRIYHCEAGFMYGLSIHGRWVGLGDFQTAGPRDMVE
jgi:hypothetical protein